MNLEIVSQSEIQSTQKDIILKIKELINYKNLEPGDKLPSERLLSEKFEVSRSNVREAIQKLEFYGILKSIPQSGTFVAEIGVAAMNGIIDDILSLKEPDFKSLVETRILLELKTVRLAALRRTDETLAMMKEALDAFTEKASNGGDVIQEDLLFHLAIAKAANNTTINTLMLLLTPQIITTFEKCHVCEKVNMLNLIKEHTDIYNAIKNQDTQLAKQKMKDHFKVLYKFCYDIKE